MIVDDRYAPSETQEKASLKGLIPYVPDYQTTESDKE